MSESKRPFLLAISGRKNSGKTTLITRILPILADSGLRVATIKHDGHDFDADVPGTDTYRHMAAGAYGTAIFSSEKYMVIKKQPSVQPNQLIGQFPEADLLLLEGFKSAEYPKIEVLRKENSTECVCTGSHLLGIAADCEREEITGEHADVPILNLNDPQEIAEFIKKRIAESNQEERKDLDVKTKIFLSSEHAFFGPGMYQLLACIEETGSLRAAVDKMEMSYTKGWKMIRKAEQEAGFPFLKRTNGGRHGGSSVVTEEGRAFMKEYRAMAEEIANRSHEIFEKYFGKKDA